MNCIGALFWSQFGVVILVTLNKEVERKSEWFRGLNFFRSNFKVFNSRKAIGAVIGDMVFIQFKEYELYWGAVLKSIWSSDFGHFE